MAGYVEVHATHAILGLVEAMSRIRRIGQVRILKRREATHVGLGTIELRAFPVEGIGGVLAWRSEAGLLGAGRVVVVRFLRLVVFVRLERRLGFVRTYLAHRTPAIRSRRITRSDCLW